MVALALPVWLFIGLVSAAAVVAVLHGLMVMLRNETQVHDLRVEAERVRREYVRRLHARGQEDQSGAAGPDVDVLPDPPARRTV